MNVRKATIEDEAGVVALWRACGLVAPYNDPFADFRRALAGRSSTILVLDDLAKGTVAGSVMVGEDGHRGWVWYLASRTDLRGRGFGTSLVASAEEWLRVRGVAKVQLLVRQENTAIVPFYEGLGYEVTPRVVMAKTLGE